MKATPYPSSNFPAVLSREVFKETKGDKNFSGHQLYQLVKNYQGFRYHLLECGERKMVAESQEFLTS
jgi:hypothetical protein